MGLNECSTSGSKGDMRPTAVTVIGIFGIVLGLLGTCCYLFGTIGAGALPMLAELAQQSGEQSPELQQMLNNPALMRYTMVSAVVGLVLSVWMVVASILLLGMKPIGYTLMLANAGIWVAWTLVRTIVGVAMVSADPTSFITALILMVFPIIVLIVLTASRHPRARVALDEVRQRFIPLVRGDAPITIVLDPAEALAHARAYAAHDDLICVTGSLFIVAAAREALGLAQERD